MPSIKKFTLRVVRAILKGGADKFLGIPVLANNTIVRTLSLPNAGVAVDANIPEGATLCKIVRYSPTDAKVGYKVDGTVAAVPTGTDDTGDGANFDEQFVDLEDESGDQITRFSLVSGSDATLLSLKYSKD